MRAVMGRAEATHCIISTHASAGVCGGRGVEQLVDSLGGWLGGWVAYPPSKRPRGDGAGTKAQGLRSSPLSRPPGPHHPAESKVVAREARDLCHLLKQQGGLLADELEVGLCWGREGKGFWGEGRQRAWGREGKGGG